jgi:hypothetical protein
MPWRTDRRARPTWDASFVGGRERTSAEYRGLLSQAGFELIRILELESMLWSVIEARAI